uniref:Uncharacterized protein n=1 Tax=Tanacetum cinerariifolium TaxID=118510 RepID=A0A6L2J8D3_TANCI|nr:hypothetical protein [Tanacetum cinerariifolium]
MGKGLFGLNGRRGGKVDVGLDNFKGEEIRNCGGNGGRGSSIFRRGGGSSSSVLKIAWGEIRGVENRSSMGSMFIAKGEECLDGSAGASGGEVKGGGVDFGVTKSLLGEIPRKSGGQGFRVDGGAVVQVKWVSRSLIRALSILKWQNSFFRKVTTTQASLVGKA